MTEILKHGKWNLTDLEHTPKNGLNVFSCFHCGGGSTMGYKLAGFNVLGGVEIDPQMMAVYRANHKPKHSYLMGVQQFKHIPDKDIPKELFNLDVLDGSPPCSSFSLAGAREKKWGKKFKFREGQKDQVLDDLFFHFIDIAEKLKPKVVVAENVKGLILGNAKGYVKEIFRQFREIGYETQLFLLNSAAMGVPQARIRTFFIARRADLKLSKIDLKFTETPIAVEDAFAGVNNKGQKIISLTPETRRLWGKIKPGQKLSDAHPKGHRFNESRLHPRQPSRTLTTHFTPIHWKEPRRLTEKECVRIQTFPDDFNFAGVSGNYVCGMSVPPYMMQRVAVQIAQQFFNINH